MCGYTGFACYPASKPVCQLVDISALFAGGELSENEKDAVMRTLQDAYWIAKERNSEKYTPKKFRKENGSSGGTEKV